MNRLAFVVLSFALAACGGGIASEATPAPAPVNDCGDVLYDNSGPACPDGLEAKIGCFLEGKRACRSSRIGITRITVEGAPITTELTVDAACTVLVRDDDTADKYSASPGVRTQTCADVSRVATPGRGACSELVTASCE